LKTIARLLQVEYEERVMSDTTISELVAAWIDEISGEVSVSASRVQDRLFDLWGALEEGEARREVERWLTETLDRELFLVAEIIDRVNELILPASVS
jgi:hypothetical protein